MGDAICSIDVCDRKVIARGLCSSHYQRWRLGIKLDGPIRASGRLCSVEGCDKKHRAHGWCIKHLRRWQSHGDPTKTLIGHVEENFWARVNKTDGCWNWTGRTATNGYGRCWDGTRDVQAHRYSYELVNGPIPAGECLDHKCHNLTCVNPDHLRPVTVKQNAEHRAGPSVDNTSGVLGVSWDKSRNKWHASVGHHWKSHFVGRFDNLADAEAAVIAKRNELFTHNDHDRIAG